MCVETMTKFQLKLRRSGRLGVGENGIQMERSYQINSRNTISIPPEFYFFFNDTGNKYSVTIPKIIDNLGAPASMAVYKQNAAIRKAINFRGLAMGFGFVKIVTEFGG